MTCPLCQTEFPADHSSCMAGCPMAGRCGLLRCPKCGYEMPTESKLVKLVRKWIGRAEREAT